MTPCCIDVAEFFICQQYKINVLKIKDVLFCAIVSIISHQNYFIKSVLGYDCVMTLECYLVSALYHVMMFSVVCLWLEY